MPFAIETLVGEKFGMWLKGERRFPDFEAAQRARGEHNYAERRCGLTPMLRRVVQV